MNGFLAAEETKPTNIGLFGSQCPQNEWFELKESGTNSRLSSISEHLEKNNNGTLENMGITFLMFNQNPIFKSYRN